MSYGKYVCPCCGITAMDEYDKTCKDCLKTCSICGANDGYDCRTCTRSDDPDQRKPLQDHWVEKETKS